MARINSLPGAPEWAVPTNATSATSFRVKVDGVAVDLTSATITGAVRRSVEQSSPTVAPITIIGTQLADGIVGLRVESADMATVSPGTYWFEVDITPFELVNRERLLLGQFKVYA